MRVTALTSPARTPGHGVAVFFMRLGGSRPKHYVREPVESLNDAPGCEEAETLRAARNLHCVETQEVRQGGYRIMRGA